MDSQPAVLIIGASSGIGLTSTEYLSKQGFLIFAGVRKQADADRITTEYSGEITPVIIDVTDDRSIANAVTTMTSLLGENGLYGLVNNAAISWACPQEYVDRHHLESQFNTNVFGPALTIKAFIPLLRKAKGRIINISSGAGHLAIPIVGTYSATKSALEALSDALRVEVSQSGINVSVVVPGAIATPIHGKGEAAFEDMLNHLPAEGHERYRRNLEIYAAEMKKMAENASDPIVIAEAIHSALTDNKPKTRYAAGSGSQFSWVLKFLSDRMKDKIVAKMTGF